MRDEYKCVHCGSTKALSVHHKDGKGRGYQGKINNSLDNLETLCNKCHQKLHGWKRSKINKWKYVQGVCIHWGKTNREIAKVLGISHMTVGEIRKFITKKLGNGLPPFTAIPDE